MIMFIGVDAGSALVPDERWLSCASVRFVGCIIIPGILDISIVLWSSICDMSWLCIWGADDSDVADGPCAKERPGPNIAALSKDTKAKRRSGVNTLRGITELLLLKLRPEDVPVANAECAQANRQRFREELISDATCDQRGLVRWPDPPAGRGMYSCRNHHLRRQCCVG